MIQVTKTFLPPKEEYDEYLQKIWDEQHVTNNGQFVLEFENKMADYLGVDHLIFVANGTLALQLAIKALELKGEVITTPFSYVATTHAIIWENCKPVFADIEPTNYNIDPAKVEELITPETSAILATHVYGLPCDHEALQRIADKHNIKLIYDGAHAFDVKQNGESILNWGDMTTMSFHATKVFHTIEGGAIVTSNNELAKKLRLQRAFGHYGDEHSMVGINAKNSEMHAAMGLCLMKHYPILYNKRLELTHVYNQILGNHPDIQTSNVDPGVEYNYGYYPVLFKSEEDLLAVKEGLFKADINVRRYFHPALNNHPSIETYYPCPNGERVASAVCCLPLYPELAYETAAEIATTVVEILETCKVKTLNPA